MTDGRDVLRGGPERPGREFAGPWGTDDMPPPRTAWRLLASGDIGAAVVVNAGRRDEVDIRRGELAGESGLLDGDGVFLHRLHRAGARRPRGCTRGRLTGGWDPTAGPEFVATAESGDTVPAVTSAAGETKITGCDGVGARIEAAMRCMPRDVREGGTP